MTLPTQIPRALAESGPITPWPGPEDTNVHDWTPEEVRATWRRMMHQRMAKILDEDGRNPAVYDATVIYLAEVIASVSQGDLVVLAVRGAHEGFVTAAMEYWNRVVAAEVGEALRTRKRRPATIVNVFTHGPTVALPVAHDDPDGTLLLDEAPRVWARLQDEICSWTSFRRVALTIIDSAQFTYEQVTGGRDDGLDATAPTERIVMPRHAREERRAS